MIGRIILGLLFATSLPIMITATPWTTPQIVTTISFLVAVGSGSGLIIPVALKALDEKENANWPETRTSSPSAAPSREHPEPSRTTTRSCASSPWYPRHGLVIVGPERGPSRPPTRGDASHGGDAPSTRPRCGTGSR